MNIIQCYAPTNDSEEDKEDFYNRLQTIIDSHSWRDITMVMGDINAKIGRDNSGYEEVMGREDLGEMNENGERFADLCAVRNLVIGGSVFPHRQIHKATWISPHLSTENQIDHVCITKKFRRSLQDVRVRRGADVASDHHLLVACVKLKLSGNWTRESNRRHRFNTALLRDSLKLGEFKMTLANRFQALQEQMEEDDEEETVDKKWKTVNEVMKKTCQEVLSPLKYNHKEWISKGSLKKIERRKEKKAEINNSRTCAEKAKAQEQYSQANKSVKKSIKVDKKIYVETLVAEAEEADRNSNMKDLYATTKKLAGKFSKPERPVKNKEGKNR